MQFTVESRSRVEICALLERAEVGLRRHADLDEQLPRGAQGFDAAAATVTEQRRRYQDPFRLVVVGEFNAGKSSLVNALLGRSGLLLEGVTPTTGAITELWYGDVEGGEVRIGDEVRFTGPLAEVMPYSDQRTPQGRSIAGRGARILLRLDCELLRNLVVIDTPGLGASPGDDEITRGVLHLADAALLVVSGLHPGGEQTLRLAEWLRVNNRRVMAVVSRLDLVGDREDVLAPVRDLLHGAIDGEPIGFVAPEVERHLTALAEAEEDGDDDDADVARQGLAERGYDDLLDRLQSGFLAGDAARGRMVAALTTVDRTLTALSQVTSHGSADTAQQIHEVQDQLTQTRQHVDNVLEPKVPFLDQKIDDAIEVHISEFVNLLGDAVSLYLDKLASSKLSTGARALWARGQGKDTYQQFLSGLGAEFEELFPRTHLDITERGISRSVSNLLRSEWGRTAAELSVRNDLRHFDVSRLTRDVVNQVSVLAGAMAATLAGFIGIALIPGGAIVDVVLYVGSAVLSGFGVTETSKRATNRINLAKHEARMRLRGQRRELIDRLSTDYRALNRSIADRVVAEALGDEQGRRSRSEQLLARKARWADASGDVDRLQASVTEMAGGAR
jgi:tRNA U34 5-carboxymethylaminomethyl modifying GTPase MnmE/TrmE